MARFFSLFIAIAIVLGSSFRADPAQAQTFVSSAGNDANNCSFAAPCATLDRALAVTSRGGEIGVLDNGVYPEHPEQLGQMRSAYEYDGLMAMNSRQTCRAAPCRLER